MNETFKELVGIGVTFARYGLAERTAKHVREDKPIFMDMLGVISADLMDGVILRKFEMDTPTRRLADGIVDYLSIARVGAEVATKHPETRPYLGALAIRSLLVGGLNITHQALTGEITKSSSRHRLTTLSAAAFALTAVRGKNNESNLAGAGMVGIAIINTPPYLKGLGRTNSDGIRHV